MRKISIVAAILSVVTNFASAQPAVAIYGVVDAGLVREQGYNNRNSDIGTNTLLAANYDFGPAKGYLAYGVNTGLNSAVLPNSANPFGGVRPTASTDSTGLLIGMAMPVGSGAILASYIGKNDKTAFNQDAAQPAVGYIDAASKRTRLYTSYGKIKNRRGAGYTVGNGTDVGSGDSAYNAGVRHSF